MLLCPSPPPLPFSWLLSPAWLARLIVPQHVCSGSRSGLYRGLFPGSCGGFSCDCYATDYATGRPVAQFPQLIRSAVRSEICEAAHAVDRPGACATARPADHCPAWCRSLIPSSCGRFSHFFCRSAPNQRRQLLNIQKLDCQRQNTTYPSHIISSHNSQHPRWNS